HRPLFLCYGDPLVQSLLFLLQPRSCYFIYFFFFFNDPATTEIYTLSLHDALPISPKCRSAAALCRPVPRAQEDRLARDLLSTQRSEEHTSELQSQSNLVCRLLLEKKKKKKKNKITANQKSTINTNIDSTSMCVISI